MSKIFLQRDIRVIDARTIELQHISSLQLMERAASTVSDWVMHHFSAQTIVVLAGPGNNGGDGLVVARQLSVVGCRVIVFSYTNSSNQRSSDCEANWHLLPSSVERHENESFVCQSEVSLIVDALFGTGLSRAVSGPIADAIRVANQSGKPILSIDMPSGMGDEAMLANGIGELAITATWTITFQFPKINFLMPEVAANVGEIIVADIGLEQQAIRDVSSYFYFIDADYIAQITKKRNKFAHKGTMGKALIVSGSKGMMGAAQLCARGCLRSGVGLLTMVVPECGYDIIQIGVPEAMAITYGDVCIGDVCNVPKFPQVDAMGIGPGLGRAEATGNYVKSVLENAQVPMVVDADALWHVAQLMNKTSFVANVPMIFTPHEGEFDRLTHIHTNRMSRIVTARTYAAEHNVVVVLKGAYTAVCMPCGNVMFNSTGNAGMATGGSGDVLTGILTGLLAQGYSAADAAVIGVYKHGAAGDRVRDSKGEDALIASDIANYYR